MVISCAVPSLIITKSKQGKKSKDKSIFDLTLNKRNGSNRRPEKCRPCELLQPAFQLRLCGGCAGGWREIDTWRGIWSRAWVGLTVTLNGPPPCPAAMPIHSHSHLPQSHPNPRPLPDAPPCMSPTSMHGPSRCADSSKQLQVDKRSFLAVQYLQSPGNTQENMQRSNLGN